MKFSKLAFPLAIAPKDRRAWAIFHARIMGTRRHNLALPLHFQKEVSSQSSPLLSAHGNTVLTRRAVWQEEHQGIKSGRLLSRESQETAKITFQLPPWESELCSRASPCQSAPTVNPLSILVRRPLRPLLLPALMCHLIIDGSRAPR